MSDTKQVLLKAILAGDVDARHLLADYLIEQGDEDEAALWWNTPWVRTDAYAELSQSIDPRPLPWRRVVRLVNDRRLACETMASQSPVWTHLRAGGVAVEVTSTGITSTGISTSAVAIGGAWYALDYQWDVGGDLSDRLSAAAL